MCQIIRYVSICGKECTIEESFVDFINVSNKTGEGLAKEILNKLQKDGLDLNDIRGQGYDNGANMAGVYNGVQVHITRKNLFAKYIPCATHSLNLVGVHAASVNADMKTFLEQFREYIIFL